MKLELALAKTRFNLVVESVPHFPSEMGFRLFWYFAPIYLLQEI